MDLKDFEKWAFKEFKIDLSAYKSNQLHRRILSLMSRVGVKTVDDYVELLKKDGEQRQKFLDFITINVTEFFRNPDIFNDLKSKIENDLIKNERNLKIWSAACSIGAEPYSIAIILDNLISKGNHKILATDIDNNILERAKRGEYTKGEIKNVRSEYIRKYFKEEEDKYIISPKIKKMVTFKKHDLILDSYERNFDLIVCRNVVIYFNQDVKDAIYKKFSDSLKKGGLLFVGATESIYNYRDYGFEKASTFIYKKL
ncbi:MULTISPECIES: CheR family methyltransferase [Clostridium]|uniref:protein-glutamate O-methyltransferase n=1 Tax=Clostridium novyi (strain NT) TaxID=386415 RepID=A0PZY4_CLONN|nr:MULTISPECIES: protein-glutamate O-methyltransferase CheR [Clostridium]ABK62061.1 chemotaxis protein methyltransferase cheR [Clostridium novyi NT]KEH88364.1 chemotaxis protein CheR [Clostridium novyi A str. NCTC 538]KEH88708.1 chemotaxis protein CheR [Clostridium novyi A str. 4540]KEH89026.1 chemotaxis protein CheR [Clostridium novyi A str. BKT29909]KEH94331.1 chemotaxis protein CheR [Clostridium botulinum C/D str. It1]